MDGLTEAVRKWIEAGQGLLAALESRDSIDDLSAERATAAGQPPADSGQESAVGSRQSAVDGRAGSGVGDAGARAARGSERFAAVAASDRIGTQRALDLQEQEIPLSVYLSSSSSGSSGTSIWERIAQMTAGEVGRREVGDLATAINRQLSELAQRRECLFPHGYWRVQNRRLVVAAAVVSKAFGERGASWLAAALDQTRGRARRNVWGFFRACLVSSLRHLDPTLPADRPSEENCPSQIFRRIVEKLPLPERWLAEPKQRTG